MMRLGNGLRHCAATAVLVLAACTAATFSGLQTDFDQLQDRARDCAGSNDAGLGFSECAGQTRTAMLDLARQAEEAAGDAGDPRTRIGLLRLAGVAGWQSRLDAGYTLAGAVSVQGLEQCRALPADQFGAPRDCAIHEILPALIAHESTVERAKAIEGQTLDGPARRDMLDRIERYLAGTWDFIEGRRAGLPVDSRIDPRFFDYLDVQRRTILCTAHGTLSRLAATLGDADLAAEVRQDAISRSDTAGIPIRC